MATQELFLSVNRLLRRLGVREIADISDTRLLRRVRQQVRRYTHPDGSIRDIWQAACEINQLGWNPKRIIRLRPDFVMPELKNSGVSA